VQKSAVDGPSGISESPKPAPTVTVPKVQSKGNLTVQVSSFKDQGEADALASRLNSATGGEFHVVKVDIPGKGIWYRVQQRSGFASREAATSYGNQLRAKNLITEFIVTTK
jgi:cell division septation protein DedD